MRSSAAAILLILTQLAPEVAGRERLHRRFDWRDGLPVSRVDSLAQGTEGFVWVATRGGVVRFDGTVFHPVDREDAEILPGSGAAGVFWRSRATGAVWMGHLNVGSPVTEASGSPLLGVQSGVIADDGALWVALPDGLRRRDREGAWQAVRPETPAAIAGSTTLLGPARDGAAFVATGEGLRRISPDGTVRDWSSLGPCTAAHEASDGRIVAGTRRGEVFELNGTEARRLVTWGSPVAAIAAREGELLWVAFADALVSVQGGRPEPVTPHEAWRGLRALLVDREGGLWCGTSRGLVHFPEPDTASWDAEFPSLGRSVTIGPGWVIYTAEDGVSPLALTESAGRWEAAAAPVRSSEPSCIDGAGAVWTATPDAWIEWSPGRRSVTHTLPGLRAVGRCAAASDGGRWLGTNLGITHLAAGGVPGPPVPDFEEASGDTAAPITVYESPQGELFASRSGSERLCRRPGGDPGAWSCSSVPGIGSVVGFLALSSGEVWAGTTRRGVLRLREGRWEALAGNDALATREIGALTEAHDGGVWIAGTGFVVRVLEQPGEPAGWDVVERLGSWQGLPSMDIADIAEADDRTLWLASAASLIRVPASSRRLAGTAPPVALAAVVVDGEPMPMDDQPLSLSPGWSRMSLRFAAPSYRDPGLLRYRMRLGPDAEWQRPTREPLFRFTAMTPGDYDVEVEASLDLELWSATPARFSFHVPRPWYRSPWLVAGLMALGVGAVFAFEQARLAVQLRLASQRARIARDLHDHLGSGLGSIGLLARVVMRSDVESSRRDALADRIRSVAGELSMSLADIVWSLKAGEANLASLSAHLAERGSALFPGDRPTFEVDLPAPQTREALSLAVRRNVLLIGIEAMYNAARHSGAEHVRLALAPAGRRWVLTITDDGCGFDAERGRSSYVGGNLGVPAMRARATEIGASITWRTPQGGGTEVCLVFAPRAEGRGSAKPRGVA